MELLFLLVLDMIGILPPFGKYKYDSWRILPVKCYIDNSVRLRSSIRNVTHIKESLEKCFIHPSSSAWGAPVIFDPKNDCSDIGDAGYVEAVIYLL
jgi:hypothetical protein